jgi:large subunit ribosomal protein L25
MIAEIAPTGLRAGHEESGGFMERITLDAKPRTVIGKKVRFMRRTGVIPVNVFGHNVESQALEIAAPALERALARAGKNALITLNIVGTADSHPVLIRNYQRKPSTSALLHVDLYQVSMTEKLRTAVPLQVVGIAPGISFGGVLLKNIEHLEIECLPSDLVSAIEVDISSLAEIGQSIQVSDLKVPNGITILTHRETVIVKIMAPEKEEEVAAPEAAPAAEAAAPAEGGAPAAEKSAA